MNKKKNLFIFGTRPEVIKLAPIIKMLKNSNTIEPILCNTEQQKELSNQALSFFDLKSDINLDIMEPNQQLANVQAKMLNKLDILFKQNKYDAVVVQGDTMTVLCGALSAFYNKIPVFYVEAGLRSYNLNEPFPEEAIRQMTTRIATLNFVPTEKAQNNLLTEGINKSNIFVVGNSVIDALFCLSEEIQQKAKQFLYSKNIAMGGEQIVLITCHRRENHGERLDNIIRAIKTLSNNFKNISFVIPVHPNPNVKNKIYSELDNQQNIILTEPLDYPVLVELEKNATLILTDSGGIQEEAPTFACPILVLRYETERPEGVDCGFAKLVGADEKIIVKEATKVLSKSKQESRILNVKNPYGDGKTSEKIMNIIDNYFKGLNL